MQNWNNPCFSNFMYNFFLFLIFAFSTLCCGFKPQESTKQTYGELKKLKQDTLLKLGRFKVQIWYPKSDTIRGTLLLLPGWNFSYTLWCDSTDVCKTALSKGFAIVAPNMLQSIYATKYFPETRKDLAQFPTKLWLTDTVFPHIQKEMQLLIPGQKNFILGLSTGGRGVALVCESTPNIWTAAAALSGDFDQFKLPTDNLSRLVYGSFSQFGNSRWKNIDNPTADIGLFATPIYLAHGKKDKIVPYSQTYQFYLNLKKSHPQLDIQLETDLTLGHNFVYWQSQLPNVWKFWEKYL